MSRRSLLVGSDEERDEIALTCLFLLLCLFESLAIGCILLMVGKEINHVRHRDFENYVHTTLEVESETDLRFKTLLIGVTVIDTERQLEIADRVLVVLLRNRV